MKLSIVGGDYRTVKLIELLAKDNNNLFVWGFENCEEIMTLNYNNITVTNNIDYVLNESNIIIGPVPLSKDKQNLFAKYTTEKIKLNDLIKKVSKKIFISGNIPENIAKEINSIDILQDEQLAILNSVATVEGTIEIAMRETEYTIYKSNILVVGYGRIGKILVDRLLGLKANVYCSARGKDLTWIDTCGAKSVNYEVFDGMLDKFDIIINTVPIMILDGKRLERIRKDSIIIDLASTPGGVNFDEAKRLGIKTLWELGIPGKIAPLSAAQYIKETIYKKLNDME